MEKSFIYLIEKHFDDVPQRPHIINMSKYINILCVNPPICIRLSKKQIKENFKRATSLIIRYSKSLVIFTPIALFSYGVSDKLPVLGVINMWLISLQIKLLKRLLKVKTSVWGICYPQQKKILKFIGNEKYIYSIRDMIGSTSDDKMFNRLQKQENDILKKASLVFVTSEKLREDKIQYNKNTYYFPNGADVKYFQQYSTSFVPPEYTAIKRPRIGYVGHIGDVVDIELLCYIANKMHNMNFILIGNINFHKKIKAVKLSELLLMPNVHYIGCKRYEELPSYINGLDVCLAPFRKTVWMEYSFPNKIIQYLSLGKPVVATEFPVSLILKDVVEASGNYDVFLSNIQKTLCSSIELINKRKNVAGEYDLQVNEKRKAQLLRGLF
jgi:glycosyltransferase involved in cell wall biosynthesis